MEEGVTNQLDQCGASNPPLPYCQPLSTAPVCGRTCSSLTWLPCEANSPPIHTKLMNIYYFYFSSGCVSKLRYTRQISIAQNSLLILVFGIYEVAPARALLA